MKQLPQFAKFTISSVISAAVDFLFFYLIKHALEQKFALSLVIFLATLVARIFSTIVNFTINKFWSFESHKNAGKEIVLFAILFVSKLSASAFLVYVFSFVKIPTVVLKMIVDTLLFFVSFIIQKFFIFTN